jgi:AGCS family alanine or glycine:cation symporter
MTIGTGCIMGAASAVIFGGFGAVFWIVLIGFLGMGIKFAEGLLATKYRSVNQKAEICGGPMYYMTQGLGKKWLGICFAVCGTLAALGGGAVINSHSMAMIVGEMTQLTPLWTAIFLMPLTAFVLAGGIKRVAKICSFLMAMMTLLYCAGAFIILISHLDSIPHALYAICTSAFSGKAISGGLVGLSVMAIIQAGVNWGMSTQHVGSGTASVIIAPAKTDVPGRQALIAMGGHFLCIILSVITALVLFVTHAPVLLESRGLMLNASSLVMQAFSSFIPGGDVFVLLILLLFGFTALAGWGYFGEKCIEFVGGERIVRIFRIFFCLSIFFGSIMGLNSILSLFCSLILSFMFITNLVALTALSSVASLESRAFFDLIEKEKRQRKSAELA